MRALRPKANAAPAARWWSEYERAATTRPAGADFAKLYMGEMRRKSWSLTSSVGVGRPSEAKRRPQRCRRRCGADAWRGRPGGRLAAVWAYGGVALQHQGVGGCASTNGRMARRPNSAALCGLKDGPVNKTIIRFVCCIAERNRGQRRRERHERDEMKDGRQLPQPASSGAIS
jgi:hypothetical protein